MRYYKEARFRFSGDYARLWIGEGRKQLGILLNLMAPAGLKQLSRKLKYNDYDTTIEVSSVFGVNEIRIHADLPPTAVPVGVSGLICDPYSEDALDGWGPDGESAFVPGGSPTNIVCSPVLASPSATEALRYNVNTGVDAPDCSGLVGWTSPSLGDGVDGYLTVWATTDGGADKYSALPRSSYIFWRGIVWAAVPDGNRCLAVWVHKGKLRALSAPLSYSYVSTTYTLFERTLSLSSPYENNNYYHAETEPFGWVELDTFTAAHLVAGTGTELLYQHPRLVHISNNGLYGASIIMGRVRYSDGSVSYSGTVCVGYVRFAFTDTGMNCTYTTDTGYVATRYDSYSNVYDAEYDEHDNITSLLATTYVTFNTTTSMVVAADIEEDGTVILGTTTYLLSSTTDGSASQTFTDTTATYSQSGTFNFTVDITFNLNGTSYSFTERTQEVWSGSIDTDGTVTGSEYDNQYQTPNFLALHYINLKSGAAVIEHYDGATATTVSYSGNTTGGVHRSGGYTSSYTYDYTLSDAGVNNDMVSTSQFYSGTVSDAGGDAFVERITTVSWNTTESDTSSSEVLVLADGRGAYGGANSAIVTYSRHMPIELVAYDMYGSDLLSFKTFEVTWGPTHDEGIRDITAVEDVTVGYAEKAWFTPNGFDYPTLINITGDYITYKNIGLL